MARAPSRSEVLDRGDAPVPTRGERMAGATGGGGAKAPAARPSSATNSTTKDEPLLGWAARTLLLVLISVMAFSIR